GTLAAPHGALLATARAFDTDEGRKVLYVVNKDDVVEKREVRLGRLHDGLREVVAGLKPGERVVVDGTQRVRGGLSVVPRPIEMPASLGARATPAGAKAQAGKF